MPQNCTNPPHAREFLVASRGGEPSALLDRQGKRDEARDADRNL
jgi:hypothetical protein